MQRFTPEAQRAMLFGQEEARRLNQGIFNVEHMLLGILRDRESLACQTLVALHVSPESLYQTILEKVNRSVVPRSEEQYLTPSASAARQTAYDVANLLRARTIHTGHLLAGILRQTDTLAARLLKEAGVTEEAFLQAISPPSKPGFWSRLFRRS